MKVLFIVPYSTEGPSNRYRVEQYLPYLQEKGIDCVLRPFVDSNFFKILYKKGHRTKKCLYFLTAIVKRWLDLVRTAEYDLIFVHIESFPFGPAILEWLFTRLGKPLIYDFEDAVYLDNFKSANKFKIFLRCPHKFYQILRLSKHIIVCNHYMRDFVRPYNNKVMVIPTSIDTEKFRPKDLSSNNQKPVIGWIGSHSTAHYLQALRDVLRALAKKYSFSLKIIGAGKGFTIPGVELIAEEWSLQKDVENFQGLDIGIYPLPNDRHAVAKTPFKSIQYMSTGVPCVASRVGGNREIILDGVNGFLASSDAEWIEKLSTLIENGNLRKAIGIAGRKTVEEKYSLEVSAPKLLKTLQAVYGQRFSKE